MAREGLKEARGGRYEQEDQSQASCSAEGEQREGIVREPIKNL